MASSCIASLTRDKVYRKVLKRVMRRLLYEAIQEAVDVVYFLEEDSILAATDLLDSLVRGYLRHLIASLNPSSAQLDLTAAQSNSFRHALLPGDEST